METFRTTSQFCPLCGTIFPPLKITGDVICYNCKHEFNPDVFKQEIQYTIDFNTYDPEKIYGKAYNKDDNAADGPTVERKCPSCGFEKMSYATLQLRSADEGQTVFFTCLKCKFKESENS